MCEECLLLVKVLDDLPARNLEANGLVRLGGEQEILESLVGLLDALLVRRHEAMSRLHAFLDLGIVDLESQRLEPGLGILLLDDRVARASNLDPASNRRFRAAAATGRGRHRRSSVLLLTSRTTSNVGLMAFALCVCEIVALVVVQREAQLALVRAKVILHKVRVLRDI